MPRAPGLSSAGYLTPVTLVEMPEAALDVDMQADLLALRGGR